MLINYTRFRVKFPVAFILITSTTRTVPRIVDFRRYRNSSARAIAYAWQSVSENYKFSHHQLGAVDNKVKHACAIFARTATAKLDRTANSICTICFQFATSNPVDIVPLALSQRIDIVILSTLLMREL